MQVISEPATVPQTEAPKPVIILVGPQMAENIGMCARAMANFGLSEMRLVAPRGGWPKKGARSAASGAVHVLERATLFDTVDEAIADLNFVFATTARERGQMKRVMAPDQAAQNIFERGGQGQRVGIMFGRERTGLENDEVALADAIITFPVDRTFSSLNLAQSVLLVAYECHQVSSGAVLPFAGELLTPPASKEMMLSFFEYVEEQLDAAGFYPADKKPTMSRNMRDIFGRMEMREQDVRTLRGALRALAEGRARKT